MTTINTTFHVEPSVDCEFRDWIKNHYIPYAIESTGLHSPLFMRIMTPMEGGTGYAVQLQAADNDKVASWLDITQPVKLKEMATKWGEKVMFFTTLMEGIEL